MVRWYLFALDEFVRWSLFSHLRRRDHRSLLQRFGETIRWSNSSAVRLHQHRETTEFLSGHSVSAMSCLRVFPGETRGLEGWQVGIGYGTVENRCGIDGTMHCELPANERISKTKEMLLPFWFFSVYFRCCGTSIIRNDIPHFYKRVAWKF